MKTIINLFFLIVLLHIFLAGCSTSSSNEDGIDGGTEESEGDTDTTAPILSEVTAVTTPSTDSTPNYTFSKQISKNHFFLLLYCETPCFRLCTATFRI